MVLDFKILLPSNKRTVVKCVRISLEFYFESNINGKALRTLNVMTQFLGPPRQLCHQKYLAQPTYRIIKQLFLVFTSWTRAGPVLMYSCTFMIYRKEWLVTSVLSCQVSTGRIKADVVWPAAERNDSKCRMKMLHHAYTVSSLLLHSNPSYLNQLLRFFPLTIFFYVIVILMMFRPPEEY